MGSGSRQWFEHVSRTVRRVVEPARVDRVDQYVCHRCEECYEFRRHVCPECGSFLIERREWKAGD